MGRTRQPTRFAALAALMLGAWLLLLQALPCGFAICLEADGQMQLELVGQACCAPHPAAGAGDLIATTSDQCTTCQDLALLHQAAVLMRVPMASPAQMDRGLALVTVLCWPAPTSRTLPTWSAGCGPAPHLSRLATIIIRC